MTKDKLSEIAALRALLSETSDAHILAEMLGFAASWFALRHSQRVNASLK